MAKIKSFLKENTIFLGIFILAFAVRVIFVFQWSKTPYGAFPLLDAKVHDQWALSILHGNILRGNAFYQSPLYPYLLALVYKIAGHNLQIVSLIQAFIGALTCVLLAVITDIYFGKISGLFAGALAALYRPLVFFTAPLMKETLGFFVLSLFLFFFLKSCTRNDKRLFFICGLMVGLMALIRGNILLLIPAILGIWIWRWPGIYLRRSLLFLVGAIILIFPVTLHNWFESHDFVLLNYTGGFDFYMGNSPTTTGANSYPVGISSDPLQEEIDTTHFAESAQGHSLRPSEVSSFWLTKGLEFIFKNPVRESVLLAKKFAIFWNDYEQPDNYDINFVKEHFPGILNWCCFTFGWISVLAALGVVLCWKEGFVPKALFCLICFYLVSVILFYVTDRYRLPILVFLFPLAGAAIPRMWQMIRDRRPLILVKALGAALPFCAVALVPPSADPRGLEAFSWGTLGALYSDMGQDTNAVEALDKAMSINSNAVDSEDLIKVGNSEFRLGHPSEAERLLKLATDLYPYDGSTFFNYGLLKYNEGDIQEALSLLNKATDVSPSHPQPYKALAFIHNRAGHKDESLYFAKKALALEPSNVEIQNLVQGLESSR